MKWIRVLLLIATALYVVVNAFFYFSQEKIIFLDTQLDPTHRFRFNSPFDELNFDSTDGASIHALHFKAENPKGIIVYSHGNAGDLERWGNIAEKFVALSYDVLIWDYRGYGKSTGKRSQRAMLKDAQLVYNHAKKLFNEQQIVVYGRSLGTGFSTYLASENSPAKLILETPYYSLRYLVDKEYPYLFSRFFMRYPMRSNEYAQRTSCAVLVLHGTNDEVVKYDYGQKLFAAIASQQKELITIEGGQHNNLAEYQAYWDAVEQFLQ